VVTGEVCSMLDFSPAYHTNGNNNSRGKNREKWVSGGESAVIALTRLDILLIWQSQE